MKLLEENIRKTCNDTYLGYIFFKKKDLKTQTAKAKTDSRITTKLKSLGTAKETINKVRIFKGCEHIGNSTQ